MEALQDFLDKLLDIVGEDESHELIGLIDVISSMISKYDDPISNLIDTIFVT